MRRRGRQLSLKGEREPPPMHLGTGSGSCFEEGGACRLLRVQATTARSPDPASRLFAAEALLGRLQDLQAHLPRLHDPHDSEPIHQTRVTCRRLRTSFELFEECFPSRQLRCWDRSVRRLGRALGRARDLDVQASFLDRFLSELDERTGRPGLDRLRLRLAQRRERAQTGLRKKLRRFERSELALELEQSLREVSVRAKLSGSADPPRWLWDQASRRVMMLVEQVLVHEPCVEQPDRVEEHHQMRIAAKHLRYALEVFSPLYEERLQTPLEVARGLQKTLGELHDCDVWIEFLPRFIAGERRRTKKFLGHLRGFRRIAQGLEELLTNRGRERERIHATFVEQWHRECGDSLWAGLRQVLLKYGAAGGGEGVTTVAATEPRSE